MATMMSTAQPHNIVFLALVFCTLGVCIRNVNGTIGTQLREMLNEERVLRGKLENRVNGLRKRSTSVNSTIETCDCGRTGQGHVVATNQSVAFTTTQLAALSSMTMASNYSFPNVAFNSGRGYAAGDGKFIAPVDGLYGFSLTIYMVQGNWVSMQLVKDGTPITRVRTGHFYSSRYNRRINMGTNFALVNMTAGESVRVQYTGESDSARIGGDDVTTFSGYLLHQF